jgi:hypothetical protein
VKAALERTPKVCFCFFLLFFLFVCLFGLNLFLSPCIFRFQIHHTVEQLGALWEPLGIRVLCTPWFKKNWEKVYELEIGAASVALVFGDLVSHQVAVKKHFETSFKRDVFVLINKSTERICAFSSAIGRRSFSLWRRFECRKSCSVASSWICSGCDFKKQTKKKNKN